MKKVLTKIFILCLLTTSTMLIGMTLVASAATQATYFVSPTGWDGNPGTSEGYPFKTLERARAVVSTVNSNMTGDIFVYLRNGVHTLSSTLNFNAADSGTNGYNIVYASYPNETAVISGGRQVSGTWSKSVKRGNYQMYRIWAGTDFYSRHLYVNGERAVRAKSEKKPTSADFTVNTSKAMDNGKLVTTTNYFNYGGAYAKMATWANPTDIELHRKVLWSHHQGPIQSISNGKVYMPADFLKGTNFYSGTMFTEIDRVENAFELLDKPGEWYLHRNGYLYYIPKVGEIINKSRFVFGKLEKLINGNSSGSINSILQNVQFKNIVFENTTYLRQNSLGRPDRQGGAFLSGYANNPNIHPDSRFTVEMSPSALDFKYSKNIVIDNCTLRHIGTAGIGFGIGSQNNVISNCGINDISMNGITIGGISESSHNPTDARYIVQDNVITECYIKKIGAEIVDSVGIFGGYVKRLKIDRNTIYDVPYTPISVGWGWGGTDGSYTSTGTFDANAIGNNEITNNLLEYYMHSNFDGGGIYTLGRQDGSMIANNYLKAQRNQYAYIYLDNGSQNITVRNNVVDHTGGAITTSWLLANDNCGSELFYTTTGNYIHSNYYSSGLGVLKCPATNSLGPNYKINSYNSEAVKAIRNNSGGTGPIYTTATASSEYPGTSAAMAIDGNATGSNMWHNNTNDLTTPWIKLDLRRPKQIKKIQLVSRQDYEQLSARTYFKVQASHDSNFSNPIDLGAVSSNAFAAYGTWTLDVAQAESFRYIRVIRYGTANDAWLNFSEIRVFEELSWPTLLEFKNLVSGLSFTPAGHSPNAGTNLIQWYDEFANDQKWYLEDAGAGYFKIKNCATRLAITPSNHSSAAGTGLILWHDESNMSQMWRLEKSGNGIVKFVNRATGLILIPGNYSQISGEILITWYNYENNYPNRDKWCTK